MMNVIYTLDPLINALTMALVAKDTTAPDANRDQV